MQNKNNIPIRIITLAIMLISSTSITLAEDLKEILNLRGTWKFSIGDNPNWANPEFDHNNWDEVYVPRTWEDNGYRDYNGYAWYRKDFYINENLSEESVYLCLGNIDDADEVYFNGKLIGKSGRMAPNPLTALKIKRQYLVPTELINIESKNTIAVRVYDFYEGGGIRNGDIGIYGDTQEKLLELNLAGYWEFETEHELKDRLKNKNPRSVSKVFVPGYWESNGYTNFNGKARYQTLFNTPKNIPSEDIYLVLGFIDDIETVYLNGEKIGSIIAYEKKEQTKLPYDLIFRGYKIPKELLKSNEPNILSVLIYDKGGLGGIYKGPIGIATEENFEHLKQNNTRRRSAWELFFGIY